jgi:hypothetical protein
MKTIDEEVNAEQTAVEATLGTGLLEALIGAAVVGVGLAFLVRVLRPPTARERATRLVQEILDQAQGVSRPALKRARKLVREGTSLVENGVNDLHLDRQVSGVANRVRGFFR